mgnify:CR=1 FL=1
MAQAIVQRVEKLFVNRFIEIKIKHARRRYNSSNCVYAWHLLLVVIYTVVVGFNPAKLFRKYFDEY